MTFTITSKSNVNKVCLFIYFLLRYVRKKEIKIVKINVQLTYYTQNINSDHHVCPKPLSNALRFSSLQSISNFSWCFLLVVLVTSPLSLSLSLSLSLMCVYVHTNKFFYHLFTFSNFLILFQEEI